MNVLFVGWVVCVCQVLRVWCVCVVKTQCPILSELTFVLSRNMHGLIAVKVSFILFIFHVPLRDCSFSYFFNLCGIRLNTFTYCWLD
jgi:hypothetical protein